MRSTFWTCESWSIRMLCTVGAGINKVLYKTTTWGVTLHLLTRSKLSQSYYNTSAASRPWRLLRRKRVCFARSLSPLSCAWSIVQAFHLTKWRRTTGTLCNSRLSIFKARLVLFFRLRFLGCRKDQFSSALFLLGAAQHLPKNSQGQITVLVHAIFDTPLKKSKFNSFIFVILLHTLLQLLSTLWLPAIIHEIF